MLGFLDIKKIRNHIVNVINSTLLNLREEVKDYKVEDNLISTQFIVGGYSWQRKKFSIYRIIYRKQLKRYIADKEIGDMYNCTMIGDLTPKVSEMLNLKEIPITINNALKKKTCLKRNLKENLSQKRNTMSKKNFLNQNVKEILTWNLLKL